MSESWEEGQFKGYGVNRALNAERNVKTISTRPHLDAAKKEALIDYVSRRKSELPDAWY